MKKLSAIGAAALIALLASCGGAPQGESVSLTFFHYKQESGKMIEELVDAFEAANPNITITPEYVANDTDRVLMSRIQADNMPELVMLQGYAKVFEFADAGYIQDLTSSGLLDKVVDGSKGAVTRSGAQWAVPTDMAAIGVLYNKDIFAANGLSVPTTFAEMQAVAAALSAKGITPMAVSIRDNWPLGHFFSMAHTAVKGENVLAWIDAMNKGNASFNEPGIADVWAAVDFYKANGGANGMSMGYNDQVTAFATGKAAMMIQGLWAFNAAREQNASLNAGFFPFPFTNNAAQTKLYADTDSTIAISSKISGAKLAAAVKFLDWLLSPAGVKLWIEKVGLIPTAKGADTSAMAVPAQDLLRYANAGQTMPWAFSMWPSATFEESKTNIAEYYSGQKTQAQVMSFLDNHWRTQVRR